MLILLAQDVGLPIDGLAQYGISGLVIASLLTVLWRMYNREITAHDKTKEENASLRKELNELQHSYREKLERSVEKLETKIDSERHRP